MKQINHTDYTEKAFDKFLKWKNIDLPLEELKQYLADSSAAEDNVSFSSRFQRPFNWHFYNNHNLIDNSWMPGRRTSEKRVAKLIAKVDKFITEVNHSAEKNNLEDLLESAGRVMHHIQDNSTPSHCVPIYHGPGLVDQYEVYGEAYVGEITLIDGQNADDLESDSRLKVYITDDEITESIHKNLNQNGGIHGLMALYENSAQATLKYINASQISIFKNGEKTDFPLTAFWQEHNNIVESCGEKQKMKMFSEGFGSFGHLCNNFGELCFTVADVFYEAEPDAYLDIYRTLFKKSILDSIVVLEYVYKNANIYKNQTIATLAQSWE